MSYYTGQVFLEYLIEGGESLWSIVNLPVWQRLSGWGSMLDPD